MKQIMSKKWIAYVKAHIEGDDYFFSFPFSIPEGLYNEIIDFLDKDQLLTSFEKYEELLSYAQIAIDYRKLCGFDDKDSEFDISIPDDYNYWDLYDDLQYINKESDNVNADLRYIRLFDPVLYQRFCDCCFSFPLKQEHVGKAIHFSYGFDSCEDYEWTISYLDTQERVVENIKMHTKSEKRYDGLKLLQDDASFFPPFDKMIEYMGDDPFYHVEKLDKKYE